jgi:hypothetical protein
LRPTVVVATGGRGGVTVEDRATGDGHPVPPALLAVDDGADRPDVVEFARAVYGELCASGRPLFAGPGLLFG